MIWFIYFGLAIASGAWACLTGQWLPLVVVCAAAIVTIVLESIQRQNAAPRKPPVVNVSEYPVIHQGDAAWYPYIDPHDDIPGKL